MSIVCRAGEAARENRAKGKQRKPRAPEANGSVEAAAPEAAPPAGAAQADAPQGKSGAGFEKKPRPAERRGPPAKVSTHETCQCHIPERNCITERESPRCRT